MEIAENKRDEKTQQTTEIYWINYALVRVCF